MLIEIINQSTLMANDQLTPIVAALQKQITQDFTPIWDCGPVELSLVPQGQAPKSGTWQMVVLDNSDQAGVLGYHQLTVDGLPLAKVFAKDDIQYGLSTSVTLSHELMEMLVDPWACLASQNQDNGNFYAYEVCLDGDTKIPLLNGTVRTLKSLVGESPFWVYSCDKENNIVPGRANSVRKTGEQRAVYKITLDNGEAIIATENHKFMMRDGTYKELRMLNPGNSLMPLYRRKELLSEKSKSEYEQCFNIGTNRWRFTHRLMAPPCPKGSVRHHKDFNRFNNSPDNLEILGWEEHRLLHQNNARKTMLRPDVLEKTRGAKSERFKKMNAEHLGKHRPELCVPRNFSKEQRKACGQRGKITLTNYNKSAAHREISSKIGKETIYFAIKSANNPKNLTKKRKRFTEMNRTGEHKAMLRNVYASPEFKKVASENAIAQNHKRWHTARNLVNPSCSLCVPYNHKVVSVEYAGKRDVYDMSVEGHHNFAVEAGIFVHNCDACEDDSLAYKINDILVSDFVTPDWFITGKGPDTQFSFKNNVHAPFTLAKGGYIGMCPAGGQWSQVTDEKISDMMRATHRGILHNLLGHGRFSKRQLGSKYWKRSAQ